MRNHTALRRLGAVAVMSAVVGLSGLLPAGTAAAAAAPPAGTLALFDSSTAKPIVSGTDVTSISLTTSGTCNVGTPDSFNVVVAGPGKFAPSPPSQPDGLIVVTTSATGFSTTDPITTTLRAGMKDFATELGTTIVAGDYVLTLRCVDGISATVFQTYSATLAFSSPTAFTVKGTTPATPAPSGAATPTPAPTASGAATPTPAPSASASATATPEPSTSATATPDPSSSVTPTVDPIAGSGSSSGGGTGSGGTGTLAYTGAPVDTVVLGGLALVVLGAALRHAGRRRGLRG